MITTTTAVLCIDKVKQHPFLIFILLETYNCNDLSEIPLLYKKSSIFFALV